VSRKRDCFVTPVGEAEKGTYSDSAKASSVSALRTIEPPIKFLLGASGVKDFVSFLVISFLINDEAFSPVIDQLAVLMIFHRANLYSNRWN
jgi:hypothetical protein